MNPLYSFKLPSNKNNLMKLQPREYQSKIISSIKKSGNTLVVLPTGLGKTLIALSLIEKTPKKSIFLTPTKPLARQHLNTIREALGFNEEECALVTGEMPPKKRKALYLRRAVSSTPQTINNDLKNNLFSAEDVGLVIFDEAHRAVGEYAYVKIAERLAPGTLILALTASPGGNKEKIKEVLANLKIQNIEIRTHEDPDVSQYVKKMSRIWIPVDLGEQYSEAKTILKSYIDKNAKALQALGFRPQMFSKQAFLEQRRKLFNMKHPLKFRAIYLSTCLLHSLHLMELLETQGKEPVIKYVEKISKSDSKSAKAVSTSPEIQRVLKMVEESADHPKMGKLLSLVHELKGKKLIIFVQYRAQIESIMAQLNACGVRAKPFMGKRDDFTKKMQEETMDAFRKGGFDVLVASSIGEEGLDIPEVDAVIFFEPIPSDIRSIQRRGRAGRFKEGAVYILMTRKTRDEYYYWASIKREKKMKEVLLSFQNQFRMGGIKEKTALPKAQLAPAVEKTTKQKEEKEKPKEGQNRITDFLQ